MPTAGLFASLLGAMAMITMVMVVGGMLTGLFSLTMMMVPQLILFMTA